MVRRTWHTCQPIDLHRMAREYFLAAKRIELQCLARELGISRATAYRWAGSAEQLVGAVVASLIEDTIDALLEQAESQSLNGVPRIAFIAEGLVEHVRELEALNRFLRQNPKQALKVLCSDAGLVRARTSEKIEQIIADEIKSGQLNLTQTSTFVAGALTRVFESYFYTATITSDKTDKNELTEVVTWALGACQG